MRLREGWKVSEGEEGRCMGKVSLCSEVLSRESIEMTRVLRQRHEGGRQKGGGKEVVKGRNGRERNRKVRKKEVT